jgi:Homing endonuclease associated repeat
MFFKTQCFSNQPPQNGGFFYLEKTVTREELITTIKEFAAQIGHTPSRPELEAAGKTTKYEITKHFGSFAKALDACGFERKGPGFEMTWETLFQEWAAIVRSLGKIPTVVEYEARSTRSSRPLLTRCKYWKQVPKRVLEYARLGRLEGDWDDVLDIILKFLKVRDFRRKPSDDGTALISRSKIVSTQPVYGPPLFPYPVTFAPTNEAGVVVLFATMAQELGFVITMVQTDFPDCEAMRQIERGRWQRLRIEFEFESRNFLLHRHAAQDCDLIICWNHNWEESPLEVLELRRAVKHRFMILSQVFPDEFYR